MVSSSRQDSKHLFGEDNTSSSCTLVCHIRHVRIVDLLKNRASPARRVTLQAHSAESQGKGRRIVREMRLLFMSVMRSLWGTLSKYVVTVPHPGLSLH